jgi:serine/threonine protein kinase
MADPSQSGDSDLATHDGSLVLQRPPAKDPLQLEVARSRLRDRIFGEREPFTLGRYIVLGLLGRGGMGVVYAAYDPELDRRVAIKLMYADLGSAETTRARMLREARALARLVHRNVISVYDVGQYEEQVYLAMELVEGCTMDVWLQERPRRWPDILTALIEAGRGLAAAHDAGLIHRDFKPQT